MTVNGNLLSKVELLELNYQKDRYIDRLHEELRKMEKVCYSARGNRMELENVINNLHDMIDFLKFRLFSLTGNITGRKEKD